MLVPRGDFSHFNKPECRLGGPKHSPNDSCSGPCIPTSSWQHNPHPATTTFRRAQNTSIVWTKNNHHGGFVRLTLVPKHLRMHHSAHQQYAFRYLCFDSDLHHCSFDTSSQRTCGTEQLLFRATVQIPPTFPDGEYVLGWAWYGGLNWYGLHSYFADYWSCANVVIKGGPFQKSYTPVFQPGDNLSRNDPHNPACWAAVNNIGICVREPCLHHQGAYIKPWPFNESRLPDPIQTALSPYSNPFHNPYRDGLPTYGPHVAYVTQIKLIDLHSQSVLDTHFYRDVSVQPHMQLTFRAFTKGDVRCVDFFMNDVFINRERIAPYLMFGDRRGTVLSWANPLLDEWIKLNVSVHTAGAGATTSVVYWFRLKMSTMQVQPHQNNTLSPSTAGDMSVHPNISVDPNMSLDSNMSVDPNMGVDPNMNPGHNMTFGHSH
ncbi:hypothetical protein BWQ96_04009 [Gracilariopsis chorda]|uniref:Uncharacterized protein n=1 Tax=Gracilariopsis chorda TaxID=448386 RepID=A0A2V3IVR3_9FLOR|nr:hypothetical protein BWQ96_04009 [Gracilariopsis chorda]|eukprot:PXF46224.1 hypothetical protein BWQ96_04009 [Gracilariopsis chorda]